MRSALVVLFIALVLIWTGCGYRFSGFAPLALPGGDSNLFLQKVDNPTQEVWLNAYVREELRREMSGQGPIRWVGPERSATAVRVRIKEFLASDTLKGKEGQSVKFRAQIVLRLEMYDTRSGELLWDSGFKTGEKSYMLAGEKTAASRTAVDLGVEKCVNALQDNF